MEQGKVYLLFILFNLKYIVILTYYLEVSFFFFFLVKKLIAVLIYELRVVLIAFKGFG